MPDRPAVLFVCLGNICRSPLAEGAFRAATAALGLEVEADSAGTGDWHAGEPPDARAQAVARRNGIDIAALRARQVVPDDFHRFSHIVALDDSNLAALKRLQPQGSTARLSLLLDHVAGREGQPVADPYFGGAEGFDTTWADVAAGTDALARRLAAAADPPAG